MMEFTFSWNDIPKVFFLALIELLLSADNAVVLGVLSSRLPEDLRKKALYIGSFSAVVIRAFLLLGIAFFIQYRWIQILGALYLLYLSFRYFQRKHNKPLSLPSSYQFWKTVFFIEMFDVFFAIDSVLAGVAFLNPNDPVYFASKLWIVYLGGVIGLIGIRFAAHFLSLCIHRFPNMEMQAHLMIGWVGLKLIAEILPISHSCIDPVFWAVLALLFSLGFLKK